MPGFSCLMLTQDLAADFAPAEVDGVNVQVSDPVHETGEDRGAEGDGADEAAGLAKGAAVERAEIHEDACALVDRGRSVDVGGGGAGREAAVSEVNAQLVQHEREVGQRI